MNTPNDSLGNFDGRLRITMFAWPLLLLLMGAGECLTSDRWRHADSFAAQLRCGMSREAIEGVVVQYSGLKLHVPDSNLASWNLVAIKGDTRIKMKLEEFGLRKYQISWVDTIMHVAFLPEVELCGTVEPTAQRFSKPAPTMQP